MSLYKVIIKEETQEDLRKLLCSEPKIYKKAMKFIGELYEHPKTGLGHPEPLKGKPEGRWSREITKKHRLSCSIHIASRAELTAPPNLQCSPQRYRG
jgi:toxin YoeB